MNKINLTKHVRHARLVKIVRRQYQLDNPGSRLFNNTSGTAWQGQGINGAGEVLLKNPRPISFGIPEPVNGSGGADLLGWTNKKVRFPATCEGEVDDYQYFPIFTGVECKTGKARLQKNQVIFKKVLLSNGGIYRIARECHKCWEEWTPIYKQGRIIEWKPVKDCPVCKGKGFIFEE